MALSSRDPIMSTFELRQEMKKLAQVEKEFKVRSHFIRYFIIIYIFSLLAQVTLLFYVVCQR